MTCYMRHLRDVFCELGLEYDRPNRELVDGAIRAWLELPGEAGCPQVWAAVKSVPRAELSAALAEALARD